MITSYARSFVMCVPMLGLPAQEISGRWCVESDPKDCYVLRISGDTLQGESFMGSRKIADATGFYRKGRLAATFIRRDNGDFAVWIATIDGSGRLTGSTLNPDGAVRWRGSYRREGAPATNPVSGTANPSSSPAGRLGHVWLVTEGVGGPVFTWKRRETTNVFDVYFANGSPAWVSTVTLSGNRVTMVRPGQGSYTGTFSADGRTATGTASWYPPTQIWTAKIN